MAQLSFLFQGICPAFVWKYGLPDAAFVLETDHFWVSPYHFIIALPPGPMEMFYRDKFL
jgi:hypothetical protein